MKTLLRRALSLSLALSALSAHAESDLLERGAQVFQSHCARCHTAVELSARLQVNWNGRTADGLYQKIRMTMPAEAVGALKDSEYIAATAYSLSITNSADIASLLAATPTAATDFARLTIKVAAAAQNKLPNVDWPHFNGNLAAQRFAPLEQLDAGNAAQLQIAWRWSAALFGPAPETKNVSTPIVVDGVMYATVGATRNVAAINAASGELLWYWRADDGARFDKAPRKGSGRGVAYWRNGAAKRIYNVTPGYFLVSLDADTGLPDRGFGANGVVDLQHGLRVPSGVDNVDVGLSFPPLVVGDVVIVGSAMSTALRPPSERHAKGAVRGFDARTGELLWTFDTIPDPGQPGAETWLNGSADYTGNAGVWAPMSADAELGLVYLPVEAPTGDHYGGHRHGDNLFSNCLVALEAKTGKLRWYYQIIHHDIWDFDNPSAPILVDLPPRGRRPGRKLVVQLTKQAYAYTFDRVTGKPIWPIVERPVPQTDVPGEWTSKTQPFPTKPAPYDRQGFAETDLNDLTPEILAAAKAAIKPYRLSTLYTPPSLAEAPDGTKGTLYLPSTTGGANWEGGAIDPSAGILYVPSRTAADVLSLSHEPKVSTMHYIQSISRPPRVLDTLPLAKPPWGRITAIDMNSGDHLWWVANADTPKEVANHPALKNVSVPRTGIATRAGLLLTKSLMFAGEGWGGSPVLRAHDKQTGKIVAEIKLPASQAGQPIAYRANGKEFIAMFVGDGKQPGELVALALPDAKPAATPRRTAED